MSIDSLVSDIQQWRDKPQQATNDRNYLTLVLVGIIYVWGEDCSNGSMVCCKFVAHELTVMSWPCARSLPCITQHLNHIDAPHALVGRGCDGMLRMELDRVKRRAAWFRLSNDFTFLVLHADSFLSSPLSTRAHCQPIHQ